jgi:putative Ca2+/H+ antiporter (TMEM165/GDT1 family)
MNAKEMPLWNHHFLIVICTPHLMKLHPFLQLVSCLLFLIFGKKAKKKGKKNQTKTKELFSKKEHSHCVILKKITNAFRRRNMGQKADI